jgi:CRISPR-associated protein (TIGR03984 family)
VVALETLGVEEDVARWFEKQPNTIEGGWFLAHADDGVIWGQKRGDRLLLSNAFFPTVSPPLRAVTLQQARLFGEHTEIRLWRNGGSFSACRLEDFSDSAAEAFNEEYLLWGDHVQDRKNAFSLMADGTQGLLHAVPLDVACSSLSIRNRKHPLRLTLRHYLSSDADGRVHISLGRLVNLVQV